MTCVSRVNKAKNRSTPSGFRVQIASVSHKRSEDRELLHLPVEGGCADMARRTSLTCKYTCSAFPKNRLPRNLNHSRQMEGRRRNGGVRGNGWVGFETKPKEAACVRSWYMCVCLLWPLPLLLHDTPFLPSLPDDVDDALHAEV